jgi:hypothetical protein
MKAYKVKILSADGKTVLGEVSSASTSVGASKIAGGPVAYSSRFGFYAWVKKES